MRGGSLIKETLSTGVVDIYEIQTINIGGVNEIGLIEVICLTRKNTISGEPQKIIIPSNMVYSMRKAGILKIYDLDED